MARAQVALAETPTPRLPEPHLRPADAREPLVIVGNGMVGHRLCRRLSELGATERYRVIVFGEEPRPAYDRVHLTDLIRGGDGEALQLAPRSWYDERGIELHLADPVVAIDRRHRTVVSASGISLEYGRLVLATGSAPRVPSIDGADLSQVFVYRTIADLQAIDACARQSSTAAVIGGGLLGLEAARALQQVGLHVTVVETAPALMPAQLDQHAGDLLREQLAGLVISVRISTVTRRISAAGRRRTLHFADGGTLSVDLVVIATGVRPRSGLAAACGLARCPEDGVIVDDGLATSDPRIFAIGECASHRSRIYGLVAPGYAMADALAATLTGTPTAFAGARSATRLKLLGVDVATAGEPLDAGHAVRFHGAGDYRLLRIMRGRLVGALGVGPWRETARIQDATARHARVWPWQLKRFERTGVLWSSEDTDESGVANWPADAVVCQCVQVTRGQLATVCGSNACDTSVETLIERTRASTLCGTCRPLLAALVAAPPTTRRIQWGLLTAAALASVAAAILAVMTPVAFATSTSDRWHLDLLWTHARSRQVSGFTLLVLSALAAALTVRKRWMRLATFGGYPAWRFVHAVLGLLTLVALAAHTGGRLGHNLNRAVMTTFLAINVVGAAGGVLTAVAERAGTRAARRCRAAVVTAHILATWPLPPLVAFHVLSAYYF